jgi:3-hydroxyisobutyrate dehydrogenase
MDQLVAEGAVAAADLPSLARECDIVLMCLPTSAIVRDAIFGPGGLIEGLSPGKIVVDQTTGDPFETRAIAMELSTHGVRMMDAPVSGGPRGAAAGTIAIMCGGEEDLFDIVRPVLASISPNYIYCGGIGNGHVAKLVNNAVATCNRFITYEAAAVAVGAGLALSDLDQAINSGAGRNGASERLLPIIASYGKVSDFQVGLMAKDLGLATKLGVGVGAPMIISNLARALIQSSSNIQGYKTNMDEIPYLIEQWSGLKYGAANSET